MGINMGDSSHVDSSLLLLLQDAVQTWRAFVLGVSGTYGFTHFAGIHLEPEGVDTQAYPGHQVVGTLYLAGFRILD